MRIKHGFSVFNTKYGFSVFNTKYGNTEKKFVPTPKLNRVKNGIKMCYLRIKYGFSEFNTKYYRGRLVPKFWIAFFSKFIGGHSAHCIRK